MPDRSNIVYQYDGSFEGMLCCVFESYARREIPSGIMPQGAVQLSLYPAHFVATDLEKSERVLASIPQKMGGEALYLIKRTFLTCLEQKELDILLFMRLGYRKGPRVMDMLADTIVDRVFKAVKYLENESNQYRQFLRFSEINNVLAGIIEPHNYVLPMITQHFCERFPCERFLIYDKTHGMALVHRPNEYSIVPLDGLSLPKPDESEERLHALWQMFYNTIEIQGRHNEKCRMGHMPKRYWKYMTEFGGKPTFEDVMAEKQAEEQRKLIE
jgi:probable DNA metabolism protein